MAETPVNIPPLSGLKRMQSRRSKNPAVLHTSPEWFWKLSPTLPELWIRDTGRVSEDVLTELEASWLYYQRLSIPGKGDGASPKYRWKRERQKLELEYSRLDDEVRRAKEVALARYPAFTIRGTDGSLDYNTSDAVEDGGEDGEQQKSFWGRVFKGGNRSG